MYFLGGVIVLSSCGSEPKEARFFGESAPITPHVHTQRNATWLSAVPAVQLLPSSKTLSTSVLFFFRPKRGVVLL